MSENNPFENKDNEPVLPPVEAAKDEFDIDKIVDDVKEKANVTINYTQEKAKDPKIQRIAASVGGILISTGITYWAAKRGIKAGMKDYAKTGQILVETAANYADMAHQNAEATFHAINGLQVSVETLTKNAKKR